MVKRAGSFELSAVSVPPFSCADPGSAPCPAQAPQPLGRLKLLYPSVSRVPFYYFHSGPRLTSYRFPPLLSCQVLRRWPPQVPQGPA